MSTVPRFFPVMLVVLFLSGCGKPQHDTLVLTGSSTVAPLISDLAADFEALNPGVRVDVQSGGSSRGLADVRQGTAALGMISRELRSEESGLQAHVIARDGISLLVHARNPVTELSDEQVRRLFRGEIANWQEVTDFDARVSIVHKGEGRATLDVFLAYFALHNRDVKADLIVGENQQGIRSVAGNPGAIGYVSIGSANYEIAQGVPVKGLAIAGVAPDATAIAQGDYPLSRNLNLVTQGELGGLAADFVAYARSPQAHERIQQHFFTPVVNP
ncbi:MAG: phosphate ABC transporter substrate-binding protein [Halomonadaceae bacterium]|nr:MAG: phosphate ABC transporter substrate-binding protein [Halomonadaceae bacterium]